MDNEKKGIGKKVKEMFTKKGFLIELDDALVYPSSKVVIENIEKYAERTKESLEFTSKEKPVMFYLDKVLYSTKISMARGGYILHCKEI